ncbi:MAG: hypothetical protein PHE35_06795 [Bacteroidales bacterium]|jgi:hypothetical protein|nr:hypothetical protein [Synergistaceae bacterium]MDD2330510.1 hypothetical protein [Bacteroidales bacterium]MDD3555997.1 hypothetical protein [Proteiniphilum sp.]MDD2771561.1 hypothetical protein [Bacteroidales bacterium]MDD3105877.1 hypothetical protein [Bacteroidales bacterium]
MEAIITRLQRFINEFTSSRLKKAIDLFELKSEYWDDNTLHTHIREEIYKASCELVELHEKFPILHIITNFPDLKNVLWDSTFIESITPDERKKYHNSENISLNHDKLKDDPEIYDGELPYFSGIISSIYLTDYIAFLQSKLPEEITADIPKEEKSTFEAQLNPAQIKLLAKCLNEVRMFPESITSEALENIFSCNLSQPLKARSNRLLAYFFSALDDRSLITRNWQSVIDKNRLFLSSKSKPLKQSDLSTANSEIKFTPPIGSEIIDKYLKQLKEH